MLKKLGMMLLAVSIGTLLSSCLVKKEDPANVPSLTSTDTKLHIYKPNDRIDYQVIVYYNDGSSQSGTLSIKWDSTADLINPLTLTPYPVLKETTTLTINNSQTDELVRYVEQDNTTGSLYLRAFDTAVQNEYLWLSESLNVSPGSGVLDKFEIFHSPLTTVDPSPVSLKNFYVLGNCNTVDCSTTTREAFSSLRSYQVTAINKTVDTPYARFSNAYTARYKETINREATAPLFDILDVCGVAGNISSHNAVFSVVPEIGIVRIDNTCTDQSPSGSSTAYTIEMVSTTITY